MIRQLFEREEPRWITAQPPMEDSWNACTQTLEGQIDPISSIAVAPDGITLASASYKTIKIWDVTTGTCMQTLEGHPDCFESVAFVPDGRILASKCDDHTVEVWDVTRGTCMHTLKGHKDDIKSVAFAPDGHTLGSGSEDHTIKVWDVTSGTCIQTLEGHEDGVMSVAFVPDGRTIASGSSDCTIKVWDVMTGTCTQTLEGHEKAVMSVGFAADNRTLISGSRDCTIKVWDVTTGGCTQTLEGHSRTVYCVALASDGNTLASGSGDRTIRIWDLTTGICIRIMRGHGFMVRSIAFTPDNCTLASGFADGIIKIWDIATDEYSQTQRLEDQNQRVSSVSFAPDGRALASGCGSTFKIWDVVTGFCTQRFECSVESVTSIAFTHDGNTVVTAGANNLPSLGWKAESIINFWDAGTGKCTLTLTLGHLGNISSLALAHDGRVLVSAHTKQGSTSWFSSSWAQIIDFWEVATGARTQTLSLEGYAPGVLSMLLAEDCRTLAAAFRYGKVAVLDGITGACIAALDVGDKVVKILRFGSDNTRLHTNIGTMSLDRSDASTKETSATLSLQPCSPSYGICWNGTWVTRNDEKILWIPPEYRSNTWTIMNTTIAIGCQSGCVIFLSLSDDKLVT